MSAGSPGRPAVLALPGPFPLELGGELPGVQAAYRTWGRLAPAADNAVLVCHALTGSADVDAWWPGLVGPGRALDPRHDFVVCSNVLGSCYGTTGPATRRPDGRRWGPDFPRVTIRDMVRVQARLLDALGVRRLRLVVGGSLGGMQVLEWAALFPDRVDAIAPIAVSGRHSAWCIGISEAQRQALAADPAFRDGAYPDDAPPTAGLRAARIVAMLSYRSRASLEERFGRRGEPGFAVSAWLGRHGDRLVARFDANAYAALTHAMDTHDLGRGRGGYARALGGLDVPALVVGIGSDVLYPPVEQAELADLMPDARLAWIESPHGHDAFLVETEQVDRLLRDFRARLRVEGGRAAGRAS